MTTIETRILEVLRLLETEAAATPRPDLRPRLRELDDLNVQLPPNADPELRHFLQRRSYEKARLLLEDRSGDIQRGGCTRHGH